MWICSKCGEESDDNFEICWNCQNVNTTITVEDSCALGISSAAYQLNVIPSEQNYEKRLPSNSESEKDGNLMKAVACVANFFTPIIKITGYIPVLGSIIENFVSYFLTLGKMINSGSKECSFFNEYSVYDNNEVKHSLKFLEVGLLISFLILTPYIFSAFGEAALAISKTFGILHSNAEMSKVHVLLNLYGKAILYIFFCHLFLIFFALKHLSIKKTIIILSYVYGFSFPLACINHMVNWSMLIIAFKDPDIMNSLVAVTVISAILAIIIISIILSPTLAWLSLAHDISKKRVFFAVIISLYPASAVFVLLFSPIVSSVSNTITRWLSYIV